MKKIFLVLVAMTALLSAEQSDFDINELQNRCNNNNATVCTGLGTAYYLRQDYKKAGELYSKACDLESGEGCFNLGGLYINGKGVRQDYKKASELYSKACDLGNGVGCFNLGFLYKKGLGVRQDKSTAKEYLGKACDLGDQIGCDEYKKLNEQGF